MSYYTPIVTDRYTAARLPPSGMTPGRVTLALERREPYATKAACTVPRGRGDSNAALLPDYLHEYDSPRQAQGNLATYMGFYNQARPHQALGYLTPAQVYFGRAASDQKTSRTFVLPPAIQIG